MTNDGRVAAICVALGDLPLDLDAGVRFSATGQRVPFEFAFIVAGVRCREPRATR